jgi:penicillin amidase
MIVNTGDWDAAEGTNGPGQSGNPDSPFYSNLFEPWAKDQYFPVYYSRSKIDSVAVSTKILLPLKKQAHAFFGSRGYLLMQWPM